ncbi:RsmB/NOP family class I SAM-dependent RNA methyltransferase [Treponema parvum]|nr:RsmB/NOP family class I SAM-dependent RNA methyltransferase [Treponema parvum]
MSKKMREKEKLRGELGFEAFYSGLFSERWPALKEALSGSPRYAEWNAGGEKTYFLDAGSVAAAAALPLKGAKNILDLCAAPGGKTLVLASLMDGDARLTANDRSASRKQRLIKVCFYSLPKSVCERVSIVCSDGAKWCVKRSECFDRILLDAPCSSERHIISDPKYLLEWSPSRIKTLAIEQWALLSSAYRVLSPGGFLLYSTCSLSSYENDGVIDRLFAKFPQAKAVFQGKKQPPPLTDTVKKFTRADMPSAEPSKYGFHILPDKQNGAGPLFFALIQKPELS